MDTRQHSIPNSGKQYTYAPSEKHLEDYIWNHPECLGSYYDEYGEEANLHEMQFRQFCLPSGRVDLVSSDWRICLIELKRDCINAKAVVQILRYMNNMRALWLDLVFKYTRRELPHHEFLSHYDIVNGPRYDEIVCGMLIGHSVASEDLYYACAEANVEIRLYEFDGTDYLIKERGGRHSYDIAWAYERLGDRNPLLDSPLGILLRDFLKDNLSIDARRKENESKISNLGDAK